MVLIPGLGQSPGEGKGYPLQYSGMENSMDYSPWGRKELDTTERFSLSLSFFHIDMEILQCESPHGNNPNLRYHSFAE